MTCIKIYITTNFIKFNNSLPKLFSILCEMIFKNPPVPSSEHLLWPKKLPIPKSFRFKECL
jgi:hypothetical protein